MIWSKSIRATVCLLTIPQWLMQGEVADVPEVLLAGGKAKLSRGCSATGIVRTGAHMRMDDKGGAGGVGGNVVRGPALNWVQSALGAAQTGDEHINRLLFDKLHESNGCRLRLNLHNVVTIPLKSTIKVWNHWPSCLPGPFALAIVLGDMHNVEPISLSTVLQKRSSLFTQKYSCDRDESTWQPRWALCHDTCGCGETQCADVWACAAPSLCQEKNLDEIFAGPVPHGNGLFCSPQSHRDGHPQLLWPCGASVRWHPSKIEHHERTGQNARQP
jgi:hypothetical protein